VPPLPLPLPLPLDPDDDDDDDGGGGGGGGGVGSCRSHSTVPSAHGSTSVGPYGTSMRDAGFESNRIAVLMGSGWYMDRGSMSRQKRRSPWYTESSST
jgi:hypothetical protein